MGYALPRPLRTASSPNDEPAPSPSARVPWTSRFSSSRLHAAQIRAAPFALGVTPASGFDHRASRMPSCHHDARVPADLPRVHSPTALSAGCVHVLTRLCLARYVPSSGLLTLLTVSSATHPAGLFHPAHALGVHPFRATSRRAESPLDALCPPDVSTTDRTRHRLTPSASAEPWFERSDTDARSAGGRQPSPSGLCSLRRPGTSPPRFRRRRVRKLSWASSSPGALPRTARSTFHVQQLPWGSHRRLLNRSSAGGRSATLRSLLP